MKKTKTICLLIVLIISGCKSSDMENSEPINVDVTKSYPKKELILQDFMDVEYIPLETKDEFITMGYVQAIGKDVIIVRNRNQSSDGDIFLFDRSGKALNKINRKGPGVGEYNFLLQVTLDDNNNELFVNDHQAQTIYVYNMLGNFKRSFKHKAESIYDPVYNFDDESLICLDYITDFEEEHKNRFLVISKQDGRVIQEIDIQAEVKKSTVLVLKDNGNNIVVAARNQELIPFDKSWILVDPSSDTIYNIKSDFSMAPFITRTPSIKTSNPEIFLFPNVLTDKYYFLQTAKKEYNWETDVGFPRINLMYDNQENSVYRCTIYNNDYSKKEEVDLVNDITLINNSDISFIQKIEAYSLVEAYNKGELKGKLKEIAAELDEESNPVLMLAKPKK